MKIAVIDDEQRYMDILARVCNGYFTIRSEQGSVDCFLNGQDFLNKCSENLYDAAFIDIYMSPINGIELAEELRKISKDICYYKFRLYDAGFFCSCVSLYNKTVYARTNLQSS